MNLCIERELLTTPGDWQKTTLALRAKRAVLRPWMRKSAYNQVLVIGDEDTEGLAHWGARTLGLVSRGIVWSTTVKDILAQDAPRFDPNLSTMAIFLSRHGGLTSSVEAMGRLISWYRDISSLSLSSRPGPLTSQTTHSVVFPPEELTRFPTWTPTRLQVAMMIICGWSSGKDALEKRAYLLPDWYRRPTLEAARTFAALSGELPIHLCVPSRLASHCLPLKDLLERQFQNPCMMRAAGGWLKEQEPHFLVTMTSRGGEKDEMLPLERLVAQGHRLLVFSSTAQIEGQINHSVSSKATDIGRTVLATLSLQWFLFFAANSRGEL